LSGGERARLLLARLFARPANVLVLDEPTNDLDIETLELLEELLQDYPGTVFLVSHDRAFLDNVVTQTIAYEGDARWRDYIGGYEDWLVQRGRSADKSIPTRPLTASPSAVAAAAAAAPAPAAVVAPVKAPAAAPAPAPAPAAKSRLSSWDARELAALPDEIAKLEAEQVALSARLADGELYRSNPAEVERIQARATEIDGLLLSKMERWEALEAKQ